MERGEHDPRTTAAGPAFDLNAALAARRAQHASAGLGTAEQEELDDHLRSQHAARVETGLAPEAAWWLAARRLGPTRELAQEFGTMQARLPAPLVWMLIGYLAVSASRSGLLSLAVWTSHWSGAAWPIVLPLLGFVGLVAWMARAGSAWMARPGAVFLLLLALHLTLQAVEVFSVRWLAPSELMIPGLHQGQLWPLYALHIGPWAVLLFAAALPLSRAWLRSRASASA